MPFFLHRLLHAFLLLVGICLLNFFLFQFTPGDPSNLYFGANTKQQNLEALRQQMQLHLPWYAQLKIWSTRALTGDLGVSWSKHRPVVEILKEAIPATLQLASLALLLNMILGSLTGLIAGIFSERWSGKFLDFLSLTLYSVPAFCLSLLVIFVFSLKLQWLPAAGMRSFFAADTSFGGQIMDRIRHLILPAAVLGLTGAAATSRYVRANVLEILNQNYIRMALAKGLSKPRVYLQHAFKNALLPVVTLLGLYLPFLLSGAFIIEVIFAWPGMGRVAYEAIFARDYPLIMAVNFIAAAMVIFGNLLSDLFYQWADPRIQLN